jgi:NCS1 family nucleobase:cation symporter-1
MPEFLPASMAAITTGYQFVGFIVFWTISTPFLFIRPEKFKWPFRVTSIYCGIGMLCMMTWALVTAKGVGPLMTQGQNVPSGWKNSSWLMMAGINQMLGGIAAGITNSSDFSRYAKGPKHYVGGTILSAWIVGVLVSFIGLVTTSASQKIYGEVYWNPPDLLMVMMDNGHGSSKARAGVFFLAFGFALTACFENICGNAVAGGIDLAGLFPRYIDIRRGAIITFVAAWICQPWQLINRAATFVSVLSSFSVFLSPIIGIMATDFLVLRRGKIQLSHLYRTNDTSYWFFHGVNWRAIVAWLCGWAPTVGGLVLTAGGNTGGPKALYQLYYMAFLVGKCTRLNTFYWLRYSHKRTGFFISASIFFALNKLFPVPGMGEYDEVDYYGTFTSREVEKWGVIPIDQVPIVDGDDGSESQVQETFHKKD